MLPNLEPRVVRCPIEVISRESARFEPAPGGCRLQSPRQLGNAGQPRCASHLRGGGDGAATMSDTSVTIRRALISASDKRGLIELANVLAQAGIHLLASGGTHAALTAAGLKVVEVADYTGQPEVLGGRVKTLHPKIHGGILAHRDVADDLATLVLQDIEPIDLVVVNLYPFEATAARPDASFEDAVENIDIGGPALIRAAAKNHSHVVVVTSPDQYESLIASIRERGGTDLRYRRELALAAFQKCAYIRPGDCRLFPTNG